MPSLRGITVHVTDKSGNNLAEWGVQYLRQHVKGGKVSAYIQSTTGVQFHVSVQPRIPFINADYPGSEAETQATVIDSGKSSRRRRRRVSKYRPQSPSHPRSGSEDHSTNHNHGRKHGDTKLPLSSPIRQQGECVKHPKYSFLAALYLDGRSIPERRVIVYLDPADSDFNAPHGKVLFKHRWVQSNNGAISEHAWVFKEKAIETVFDRLMISSNHAQPEGRDENAIIEAMQTAGLGDEQDFGNKMTKVGQIVVEIRRIVLGQKTYDHHYRSRHREGQNEDIDMVGLKPEITHATGFSHVNTIAPAPHRVVDYYDYKPGEGNWATFQFFYRSAEQLQHFGFGGFQPVRKTSNTGRALNARMANFTPLSIAHQFPPKIKEPEGDDTYEAKVKGKVFKPEHDKTKHDFGSDYRDASADDEFEAEETNKYPSAPLPFLVPKAPRLGPQRNNSIPGLPALNPEAVSAVASRVTAAAIMVDLKLSKHTISDGVVSSANSVPATPSTAFYDPDRDPRRQPRPYSDLGEAFTSSRPEESSPCTAEQISFLPQFSKENIAKLSNISEKDYRPSPSAPVQDSDGDGEAADDELNTESDLESQADDDDFEYSGNPEDKEKGNVDIGYESLGSRFKKIEIRKRTFSETEDVKDGDDEVRKEIGVSMTNGKQRQENSTSVTPLTEEEKEHMRHGKKAKTEGMTDTTDATGATVEATVREDISKGLDHQSGQ